MPPHERMRGRAARSVPAWIEENRSLHGFSPSVIGLHHFKGPLHRGAGAATVRVDDVTKLSGQVDDESVRLPRMKLIEWSGDFRKLKVFANGRAKV